MRSEARRIFLTLPLAAAAILAGCAGPAPRYEATPIATDPAAAAAMVSAYRVRHGLNPVIASPALTAAAQEQAMAMAVNGRMSHGFSASDTLPARLDRVGYNWSVAAENVGAGYRTLSAAFAGWVGSPHHNENLLRKGVTQIGIAAAHSTEARYRDYWSLVLAAPRPARSQATAAGSTGLWFNGLQVGPQ